MFPSQNLASQVTGWFGALLFSAVPQNGRFGLETVEVTEAELEAEKYC